MKSYQQFFAELKRRRVFKVTAVYGAVAFVLLQMAELLGQGLRLPDSFMPFITAVILLGFPLALILAWAFEVTPEGVQRTTPAEPGEIESIVAQPASKRWPAGALALLGVVALLFGAWWAGRRSAPDASAAGPDADRAGAVRLAFPDPDEDPRPSIAVLPFLNMSADENQEYFSDGITEEILNTLARIGELRVSGRTSAFAYKGRSIDLREIGAELGVRYLIEGSVRKAGDQLRITAQLIDVDDGSHLWSDTYDREFADVFAIQTEIAEAVAAELRVPLGLEVDRHFGSTPTDLDAYDLYLAGRAAIRDRGSRLEEAMGLFEAALARDSSWAPAWAALAEATELTAWYPAAMPSGVLATEYIPRALDAAETAARRAMELDPRNASANVALGSIQRDRAQWDEAEDSYLAALAIDPDNAEAHQQYGEFLLNVGRIAEAVRAFDRAAVLDPAGIRLGMLATGLSVDGRPAEAAEVRNLQLAYYREGAARRVTFWRLARSLMILGRWEEATEAIHMANEADPTSAPYVGTQDDVEEFVEAIHAGKRSMIPGEAIDDLAVEHWMLLGDPGEATAHLLAALADAPFGRVIELRLPVFAPIRSDPRVRKYLADRGLAAVEERRTPPSERIRPAVLRQADSR